MSITGWRCPEINQVGSCGIRTAYDGFHACLLQVTYLRLTPKIMRHASEVKGVTCIILLASSMDVAIPLIYSGHSVRPVHALYYITGTARLTQG